MRTPALERAGAVFETADCVVAVEECAVGEAFAGIDLFCLAVVDDGGLVFVHTIEMIVLANSCAFGFSCVGMICLPDVD